MRFWGACGMRSEVKKAGPKGALGQVSLKTKIIIEGGGTDPLALIERRALKQKQRVCVFRPRHDKMRPRPLPLPVSHSDRKGL